MPTVIVSPSATVDGDLALADDRRLYWLIW
jgi:hypothetical protein